MIILFSCINVHFLLSILSSRHFCGLVVSVSLEGWHKKKHPIISIDSDWLRVGFELVLWHLVLRCFAASCALHFHSPLVDTV